MFTYCYAKIIYSTITKTKISNVSFYTKTDLRNDFFHTRFKINETCSRNS